MEDLVRNCCLDKSIDGTHSVADHQYEHENRGNMIVRSLPPGYREANFGRRLKQSPEKKYRNYAMISHKVLFNVPATKKTRTR